MRQYFLIAMVGSLLTFMGCDKECTPITEDEHENIDCLGDTSYVHLPLEGCDGQEYPDPTNSLYILPITKGTTFTTGLTNCSRSFHGPDKPDKYASDFNLDEGTPFIAARGGVVSKVVEDQSSRGGGGSGNYLKVDHGDGTVGLYYHSPQNGIYVELGDTVKQGQVLGEAGLSGLAGYSHLHFIVTKFPGTWPYIGIPVSFSNVSPRVASLESYSKYMACD